MALSDDILPAKFAWRRAKARITSHTNKLTKRETFNAEEEWRDHVEPLNNYMLIRSYARSTREK